MNIIFSLFIVSNFLALAIRLSSASFGVTALDSVALEPAECGFASMSGAFSLRGIAWIFILVAVFEVEMLVFVLAINANVGFGALSLLLAFTFYEI